MISAQTYTMGRLFNCATLLLLVSVTKGK